jgi:hypothetical protein
MYILTSVNSNPKVVLERVCITSPLLKITLESFLKILFEVNKILSKRNRLFAN